MDKEPTQEYADPSNSLEVAVGKEFTIVLESNRTTGYQWQLARSLDEAMVKLIGSEYQRPQAQRVGAGGKEIWSFRAVGAGRTVIEMKYIRPWEKSAPPVKTASFTVTVR